MSELNMNIPVAQRLANVRADKKYLNSHYGIEHGFYSRGETGEHKRPVIWFTNVKKIPWRFTGYADDIIRLRHTGWFTDNFQNGTVRGIVVQLPSHNGLPIYLAGFACTDFDTVCIIRTRLYNEKEDAARAADSEAETYGETCREDEAKQSAETEIAELKSANKSLRAEIAALRAEKKKVAHCGHLLATGTIANTIREKTAEIAANKTRIEKLSDNYWVAVPA